MIDILNSNPGDNSIHSVCGSKENNFFEVDLNKANPETLAVVNAFFEALPKTVGVYIENIQADIEIKYFSSNVVFDENVEFVDYSTTENSEAIDNFINLIDNL